MKPLKYVSSGFNVLSDVAILLYFVGLGLQHGSTIEYYEAARIFRGVDFIAFSYMLLQYMSVWEPLGIMIPMLRLMVRISKICHKITTIVNFRKTT